MVVVHMLQVLEEIVYVQIVVIEKLIKWEFLV
jgi:hypothetical protein